MPSKIPSIEFTSEFKRNLKSLSKKYRNIRSDVEPVIAQLQKGSLPGDQIPRTGYALFKVRIQNRDTRKGKRGGYRLIYYLKTAEHIFLLTIYSKLDQADISPEQLRRIIEETP